MKNSILILFLFSTLYTSAQVSINSNGNAPDSSAMLDIQSVNRGILIPRMSMYARDAIIDPALGLMIYNISDSCFNYFDGNGWTVVGERGADDLGNHRATQNIHLNGFVLSNDGSQRGLKFGTHLGMGGDTSLTIVIGDTNNIATGEDSFVGGGEDNRATNNFAFVGGGSANEAAGGRSFVGGGDKNQAIGSDAAVISGQLNVSGGVGSVIAGGALHQTTANHTFIGGGLENTASGQEAFVGGGNENLASAQSSFVGGGFVNRATAPDAFVGGGRYNSATGLGAFTGGGESNLAQGNLSFVGGGLVNKASNTGAFVGGGSHNQSLQTNTFVGGGEWNQASSTAAAVIGGSYNTASGNAALIGGGEQHVASGAHAFIGGGKNNQATGIGAFAGGGEGNRATSNYAFIGGGNGNTASDWRAFVGGGDGNQALGVDAFVGGGEQNRATQAGSAIVGGAYNRASGFAAFVGAGNDNTASGSHSFVGGGYLNQSVNEFAFVAGGFENTASGAASFVTGEGNTAASYGEAVIGLFNTTYTPNSNNDWNASDRLFVIGNGYDNSNRSNAVTVLKNGNVGIGIDTASVKLAVDGTVNATSFVGDGSGLTNISVNVSGDDLGNHSASQFLDLNGNNIANADTISANNLIGDGAMLTGVRLSDADGDTKIQCEENPDEDVLRFDAGGNEAMIIDATGNIGIGQSAPTEKLEVAGNMRFNAQDPEITFLDQTGTNGDRRSAIRTEFFSEFGIPGSTPADQRMNFYVSNNFSTGMTQVLTLQGDGDVGIGLNNPQAKLDIQSSSGPLIRFKTDRPWIFEESGSGISSSLVLKSTSDKKSFKILTPSGATVANFYTDNSNPTVELAPNGGEVGIGVVDPTHPLHLGSGAHCTSGGVWTNASDRNKKYQIAELNYGLEEILQMAPVAYRYKADSSASIGFVAQDVEQIIPEVVSGEEGEKGIAYGLLTSVLVQGIKELAAQKTQLEIITDRQQETISGQQQEIENLNQRMHQIEMALLADTRNGE